MIGEVEIAETAQGHEHPTRPNGWPSGRDQIAVWSRRIRHRSSVPGAVFRQLLVESLNPTISGPIAQIVLILYWLPFRTLPS